MSHVNHDACSLSTLRSVCGERMKHMDRAEGEAEPETSVGKL